MNYSTLVNTFAQNNIINQLQPNYINNKFLLKTITTFTKDYIPDFLNTLNEYDDIILNDNVNLNDKINWLNQKENTTLNYYNNDQNTKYQESILYQTLNVSKCLLNFITNATNQQNFIFKIFSHILPRINTIVELITNYTTHKYKEKCKLLCQEPISNFTQNVNDNLVNTFTNILMNNSNQKLITTYILKDNNSTKAISFDPTIADYIQKEYPAFTLEKIDIWTNNL